MQDYKLIFHTSLVSRLQQGFCFTMSEEPVRHADKTSVEALACGTALATSSTLHVARNPQNFPGLPKTTVGV